MTIENDELPHKIANADEEVSEDKEREILDYCNIPRSKKEIMEHIGLKNTSYFLKTYLKRLLQDGRLEMTIPEKPTSGNQKYYAKK